MSCLPEPIKDGSTYRWQHDIFRFVYPSIMSDLAAISRISSRFQSTALNGPFPDLRRLGVRHRHIFPYSRNTVHRLTPFYGTSECLDTLHSRLKLEILWAPMLPKAQQILSGDGDFWRL